MERAWTLWTCSDLALSDSTLFYPADIDGGHLAASEVIDILRSVSIEEPASKRAKGEFAPPNLFLYLVKSAEFLSADKSLEDQGVQDGDILVFNVDHSDGDPSALEKRRLLMEDQGYPSQMPPELASREQPVEFREIEGALSSEGETYPPSRLDSESQADWSDGADAYESTEGRRGVTLSGFTSDAANRETDLRDELGVEDEVNALCSVIMAADVQPPLAIGIFGDWGTGKTYFMNMMRQRVEQIQYSVRDEPETSYCRSVAQIDFNAWHFQDASLWASIVTRIFEGLAAHFGGEGSGPWADALKETEHAKEQLDEASREMEANERARDEAEQRIAKTESKIALIETEISQKAVPLSSYYRAAFDDPDVKQRIEEAARELPHGKDELIEGRDAVDGLIRRTRRLPGRMAALWRHLGKTTAIRTVTLVAILTILAIPTLLGWFLASEAGEGARVVMASLGAIFGLLVDRISLLKRPIQQVDDALARLERIRDDAQLEATTDLRNRHVALSEQLRQARDDLAAANQQVAFAKDRVAAAEKRQQSIRSGAFISEFILEQSSNPHYKEQLGIVDAIRRDFEGLSDYLRKSQALDDDSAKLDRIILYIDDLDRCPSSRVVEVLQAVHLLLAFELFVVIVGVDSRWLLHALEDEYTAFGNDPDGRRSAADDGGRWLTTPQNYLEKIFQVPFTLRPMGEAGFGKLVDRLTADRAGPASAFDAPSGGGSGAGASAQKRPAPQSTDEGPKAPDPGPTQGDERHPTLAPRNEAVPRIEPVPRHLRLTVHEKEFMRELDDLIPTPRAAKRFVNVYRLIKATAPAAGLAYFEGTQANPGSYQAVMLLLAMQSGFSAEAYEVFRALIKEPSGSWWSFVDGFEPFYDSRTGIWRNQIVDDLEPAAADRWSRLHQAMRRQENVLALQDNIHSFVEAAPYVARFGFITGRVVRPERAPYGRADAEVFFEAEMHGD